VRLTSQALTAEAASGVEPRVWAEKTLSAKQFAWAVGSMCAVHKKPFDAGLLLSQFVPPYVEASLLQAFSALGFKIKSLKSSSAELASLPFPMLA
jgi:ATP-binding cassette, subfamily B, bacterial HlyB/CyaB